MISNYDHGQRVKYSAEALAGNSPEVYTRRSLRRGKLGSRDIPGRRDVYVRWDDEQESAVVSVWALDLAEPDDTCPNNCGGSGLYNHETYGVMICPCMFPLSSPSAEELAEVRKRILDAMSSACGIDEIRAYLKAHPV